MVARAASYPLLDDDPVTRAIARAAIETDPVEIAAAIEAERAFLAPGGAVGPTLTHDELVTSLCAHHGITREEWDASRGEASDG
jgi:hypothetical protein